MEEKKVSIVIPIFNAEKFLRRAVESVAGQSYQNLEIILVDDGSTDSSGKLCDQLAKEDKRIVVLHKQNGGSSAARNAGIKASTGEFVEFVDSDDFIEPDCVETLVLGIKNADLAICGYRRISKEIKIFSQNEDCVYDFKDKPKVFFDYVKKRLVNVTWNKLFRKNKITKLFDPKYFIGEDVVFNLEYLQNCQSVAVISKVLYVYDLTNQNSVMHTKVRDKENFESYWSDIRKLCKCYFQDESYVKLMNGQYIRGVMLQIMNTTITNNLGYKEYKRLFKEYRFSPNTIESLKNCDKNFLSSKDKICGKLLVFVLKHKLCLPFYVALKLYKHKRFGKKK